MKRLGIVLVLATTLLGCAHEKSAPATDPTTSPPSGEAAPPSGPSRKIGGDEASLQAGCCAQCTGAAKRDPVGMDVGTKDCRSYAGDFGGQPGVDPACTTHFGERVTTVGDCWAAYPEQK
jgi:hypothetical protein